MIGTLIMLLIIALFLWWLDSATKKRVKKAMETGSNDEAILQTGTFVIWCIINCLLFFVAGLFGVIYFTKYRKSTDTYQQTYYYRVAKAWNTNATILGVLLLIGTIAGNL